MRLEQFEYVVEIAKCCSMSKAAKKLFLSQPALSASISNLEAELGFKVFERSFQGVALTDKGEKFLDTAVHIVEQLKTIPDIANDTSAKPTVNIAAVPAACNSLVIDLIRQLRSQMPDVIINIQELRPIKVLTALAEKTSDICIGIHVPGTKEKILQQVSANDLRMEDVFEDSMCVYLPAHHPLAGKSAIERQELEKDTPIFFSDYIHMDQSGMIQQETQSNSNYFSFTDQASMKKAVAQGLGYAILPWQMSVDDIYISTGKIVAIPLHGEDIRLTTFLAYRRNLTLPPAEASALALIRQLYQRLQQQKAAQLPQEAQGPQGSCTI